MNLRLAISYFYIVVKLLSFFISDGLFQACEEKYDFLRGRYANSSSSSSSRYDVLSVPFESSTGYGIAIELTASLMCWQSCY